MGANNDLHAVACFDGLGEVVNVWARWVSDDQACGQMHDLGAVLFHFFGGILHVSTRTSVTGGIANELYFLSSV